LIKKMEEKSDSEVPQISGVEQNGDETTELEILQMSKNQIKRQKKWEERADIRKFKRAKEKERRKEKRKAIRDSGQTELLKKKKISDMASSKCDISVAVDMSYQSLMNEQLLKKTISQLNFSYACNRRADNPLQYHIANLNGLTKTIFDGFAGYKDWDVFMHQESIAEIWPAEDVVYLTSDSTNVLTDLQPKKIYVIGGLLDHNSHPGASLAKAIKNGFHHARLPIDEYVKLQTRKVLTINHVFEIILRFWETKDWEQAFFSVIPKRKGMEKLGTQEVGVVDKSHAIGIFPDTQNTVNVPDDTQQLINESGTVKTE